MGITVVKNSKEPGDGDSDFEGVVDGEGAAAGESGEDSEINGNEEIVVDTEAGDMINADELLARAVEAGGEDDYQFDYFVIGGGSGGLASALQAAKHGVRVGLCDFVTPSPSGTTWGLGGTCVNVGCIPKKLMHQASLLGESLEDAPHFGWALPTDPAEITHDWSKIVLNIRRHIHSLNWGYRASLHKAGVEYHNALAQFVDPHTLLLTNKDGEEVSRITSKHFLIATGGRPRYLEGVPGAHSGEHCITSDDIFSLPHDPGRVVIVGGSYIALETAGFLAGLGCDVTLFVRSQLLRGFDQQMAEKIGGVLSSQGVHIRRDCIPTSVELLSDTKPKMLMVRGYNLKTLETVEEPCNTIILAVGRTPCVARLHLENCGVEVDPTSEKILVNESDQSNVPHIFAVGDVAHGRPELTPVAIHAGVLLAKRLFGKSQVLTDYDKVATTVFTPLEYGCVGLSEERAIEKYSAEDVEVYHVTSQPLEFTLPERHKLSCYSKLICVKSLDLRIVGFHYLGPHAGEITQGFAVAVKLNATKEDLEGTIGIHPTCAEQFTTMTVTKASGDTWIKTGC